MTFVFLSLHQIKVTRVVLSTWSISTIAIQCDTLAAWRFVTITWMISKKPRRHCKKCGREVTLLKSYFCSQQCFADFEFMKRVALIESEGYPPFINPPFLRRYLVWKIGEKCSRCGWCERHPKTGRVPVEVEHVDGDWKNNAADNLTLLCPNCHSLTPTFRGLNKGRGREKRLGGRSNPLASSEPRRPKGAMEA